MTTRIDRVRIVRRHARHLIKPRLEKLEERIALYGVSIDLETQNGMRPLDGSISETTSPTIHLSIPTERIGKNFRVWLDDYDDSTDREDISHMFPLLNVLGSDSAMIDVGYGAHRIEFRSGNHKAEATMLNIGVDTDVVSTSQSHKFDDRKNNESDFEKSVLILNFADELSLDAVSDFLVSHSLTPLDIVVPSRILRVEIPKSENPQELAEKLSQLNFDGLQAALPNVALSISSISVAGEDLPDRLKTTYDATKGGFDHTSSSAVDRNHIQSDRHHFFMDTFAGHRLVEAIAGTTPTSAVTVAVIDTGFGSIGVTNPTDIPDSAIVNPTNSTALVVKKDSLPDNTNVVALSDIPDLRSDKGHGTAVAAAIAGRGSTNLGTGPHAQIRPIQVRATIKDEKISPDLYSVIGSIQAAISDASVSVINTSLGSTGSKSATLFSDLAIQARLAKKIWVTAMGNEGTDSDIHYPALLAPGPGTRTNLDPLILAVSATGTVTDISGPERLADFSNVGSMTSVSAFGDDIVLPRADGKLGTFDGTSFSSPLVAGLAAEMIHADRINPGDDLKALQIIELIEATADDLGTDVRAKKVARPNNKPENGFDPFFGHGRINVWKSLLSTINGGVSTIEQERDFPSLNLISEPATKWYGFKIRTNQLGATVWIDGEQLLDASADVPNKPSVSAYAGVEPHVDFDLNRAESSILDPGTVPIGTEAGEFLTTFSIRRTDLVRSGGIRTLSLRMPGDDATKPAYFNLPLDLLSMRSGQVAGVAFDDFVFEVSPSDFGDAPDSGKELKDSEKGSGYPTILRYAEGKAVENGARHLNTNFEWLGKVSNAVSVSSEVNANTYSDPDGIPNSYRRDDKISSGLDRADDGVRFFPMTYKTGATDGILQFSVTVADHELGQIGAAHNNSRYSKQDDRSLYVNAWIDWNGNQVFEETNNEHVLKGVQINPHDEFAVLGTKTTVNKSVAGNTADFESKFTVGRIGMGEIHARVRLDYGENAGNNDPKPLFIGDPGLKNAIGAAQYGEVEDYVISVDFGDAKDPLTGVSSGYPTKRSDDATRDGARHLDTSKEWLGATVTREFNTHTDKAVDVDSAPNLGVDGKGENGDLGDDSKVSYNSATRSLEVSYTVSSSIASLGFTADGTPESSRGKGRYDASNPLKRIYVNIWVDWNGNGSWDDADERVPVQEHDPATFGKDGIYTLGDRFGDVNHNGVYEPGIDTFDAETQDIAGLGTKAFSKSFPAPARLLEGKFYVRLRLTYGQSLISNQPIFLPEAHNHDTINTLNGPRGPAAYGEVEDYQIKLGTIRGLKWQDFFADGVREVVKEPGLNDWTITLFRKEGDKLTPVSTQLTRVIDVNRDGILDEIVEMGYYEFHEIETGTYVVGEGVKPMWTQKFPIATTPGAAPIPAPPDAPTGYFPFGHLIHMDGGLFAGKDFGNAPPVSAVVPQRSSGTSSMEASSLSEVSNSLSKISRGAVVWSSEQWMPTQFHEAGKRRTKQQSETTADMFDTIIDEAIDSQLDAMVQELAIVQVRAPSVPFGSF